MNEDDTKRRNTPQTGGEKLPPSVSHEEFRKMAEDGINKNTADFANPKEGFKGAGEQIISDKQLPDD